MATFAEFIVCLSGEFAVGEDVQRPSFSICFFSSRAFKFVFSYHKSRGKRVNNGVMIFLLASFSAVQVLSKMFSKAK